MLLEARGYAEKNGGVVGGKEVAMKGLEEDESCSGWSGSRAECDLWKRARTASITDAWRRQGGERRQGDEIKTHDRVIRCASPSLAPAPALAPSAWRK